MILRPLPVRHHLLPRHPLLAFVFALAAAILATTMASPADAARGKRGAAKGGGGRGATKVGVTSFTGPGEAASRSAASKALSSKKIVVVSGAELAATAKQLHVRLEDDAGFKAVAKSLNLTAFVTGEVTKKKATLTVRTGSDGSVVGEESFVGPDPKHVAGVVGKTFWKRLAGAFNKTNPPGGGGAREDAPSPVAAEADEPSKPARNEEPAAEPERKPRKAEAEAEDRRDSKAEDTAPEKAKPSKKAESAEASSVGDEQPWADLALGLADLMRSQSYNQLRNDLSSTTLANYSLPSGPALIGKFDFYPFALAGTGGILADLGLTADFSYLLPVVTSPGGMNNPGSFNTAAMAWTFGAKLRLPAGLFATVAYGDQWFKLVKSNANMQPATTVPSVDYKFVRIGGGIRRQVSTSLSLTGNIGYDHCLGGPGQIASATYFPKATCSALELGAAVGYRITDSIELRGGVDLRRFGLAFHVKNADQDGTHPIAGGAIDQYIHLYAAVAFILGGGDAAKGGDAESDDDAKGGDSESKGDDDEEEEEDDDGKK